MMTSWLYFPAEVVIGFINQPYNVSEDDGAACVEVGVMSGHLGRNITLQLAFSSRSATCKYRSHKQVMLI